MTTTFPDDGMCQETSGFLFNHRCDRFSVEKCLRCQKPLCDDHGHITPDGTVCTTCLKRQAQADRQQNMTGDTTTTPSYHEHHYYNDPYFYGPRYYPGYGSSQSSHYSSDRSTSSSSSSSSSDDVSGGDFSDSDSSRDPMDFTEGDAGSLRREEDGDFETDMGAS